jgi:hypothetical protein
VTTRAPSIAELERAVEDAERRFNEFEDEALAHFNENSNSPRDPEHVAAAEQLLESIRRLDTVKPGGSAHI